MALYDPYSRLANRPIPSAIHPHLRAPEVHDFRKFADLAGHVGDGLKWVVAAALRLAPSHVRSSGDRPAAGPGLAAATNGSR